MTSEAASGPDQSAQADRRARTRTALIKAAAQEFSRSGYAGANLEQVANEFSSSVRDASSEGGSGARAAYSRPQLYHLFANKEELALAVVQWAEETWYEEVGYLFTEEADPVEALLAVARGHAVFCRHAPLIMQTFKAEFEGRDDHPVGRAIYKSLGRFLNDTIRLITAAQRTGAIPPGPPPQKLALAYLGAFDGAARRLREKAPYDALLAERAASGVLGLAHASDSAGPG